ncbi:MAG: glycosyltransferase family 2 protein, partial [Desulfobaccales bacterium]
MNAYYEWNRDGRAFGVQAKYSEIYPYLREAVAILEDHHIAVNIRYAPLCTVKGMERNLVGVVGVRYDPYEWLNQAGHFGGDPEFCASLIPIREGEVEPSFAYEDLDLSLDNGLRLMGRRGQAKYFPEKCRSCQARMTCDGVDLNYLKLCGTEELSPYAEPEGAPRQRARVDYIPPFIVKTEPYTGMKKVVRAAFDQLSGLHPQSCASPPRVSVVIPCYNYGRYLPEAVASVVAQTYQDFEIIIVNDGSTDNTKEVAQQLIASYPQYRLSLINQKNSGQPAISRNCGIREARGEFILCLDAEDLIAPTMLEECLRLLEQNPEVAIAYTDRLDFDGIDQVVLAGDYDFSRLCSANHISYCAFFRKAVWEAVGGYRTNVKGVEDWDFWIAAGARGFFGRRLPKPLFMYRRHDRGVYQEVIQDSDKKMAQIILNNREVYTSADIARAEPLLQPKEAGGAPSLPLVEEDPVFLDTGLGDNQWT